jgi:DNA-binding CsgD family transcriptional regulator
MARTLFFIEAILLLLSSVLLSSVGTAMLPALVVPMATAIAIPILGVSAIWPFRNVMRAFLHAFAKERPGKGAGESVVILEALAGFGGLGAVFCVVGAVIVMSKSIAAGSRPFDAAIHALALSLFGMVYVMTSRILRNVVSEAAAIPENEDVAAGLSAFATKYGLSRRESEVAAEIVKGRSYQEAADSLFISIKTVKTHISRVYEKTGCPNKVALVLLLREKLLESYERPMVGKRGNGDA